MEYSPGCKHSDTFPHRKKDCCDDYQKCGHGGGPPQQPGYGPGYGGASSPHGAVPPHQPGYGGGPPLQPEYGGAPPHQPGYGAPPPHQPGYDSGPPLQPGYGGAPPHQPGYGAPLPGYGGGPPHQPGYGAPPHQPGYGGGPPHQPGLGVGLPHQPGYMSHGGGDYPPPGHGSPNYPHAGGGHAPPHQSGYGAPLAQHSPYSSSPSKPSSTSSDKQPTFRIYCKSDPKLNLSIKDTKVVVAKADKSDDRQHWFKDDKYGATVKDEEGFTGFALVNKATGQALKHSKAAREPVQLGKFKADESDKSLLWSLSKPNEEGYRTIRMVNNIELNLDAYLGDDNKVRDGSKVVLWDWHVGENQIWKIEKHCKFLRISPALLQFR